MEIRRSFDHLIPSIGFPILVRWHIYVESTPDFNLQNKITTQNTAIAHFDGSSPGCLLGMCWRKWIVFRFLSYILWSS